MSFTADEIRAQTTVDYWPLRRCGICGAAIGYYIGPEDIAFDPSCDCSSYRTKRPSSWDEIAATVNRQNETIQQQMLAELRGEPSQRPL